jgi:hypothetical protein
MIHIFLVFYLIMEVNSVAFLCCLFDTSFVSSLFALLAFVPVIVVRVVCCVYNSFVHGWEDLLDHLTMSSSLAIWTLSPSSDVEGPLLMTGSEAQVLLNARRQ